jgi:hypothetical protein
MPFDPNLPAPNSRIRSAELRAQFNGLKALIDAVPAGPAGPPGVQGPTGAAGISVPIGGLSAWLKSFPNTPPLQPEYVECNGQTINDPGSPYNGLNVPDLNGAQGGVPVFLRGANASGGTGGNETHSHGLPLNINGGTVATDSDVTVFAPGNYTSDPASIFPPYYEVVWVMRVR